MPDFEEGFYKACFAIILIAGVVGIDAVFSVLNKGIGGLHPVHVFVLVFAGLSAIYAMKYFKRRGYAGSIRCCVCGDPMPYPNIFTCSKKCAKEAEARSE